MTENRVEASIMKSWYAVRCLFKWGDSDEYEERITLWEAIDFDDAIRNAENEAQEYGHSSFSGIRYLGLAQVYKMDDEAPVSGSEVFSLLRTSRLSPKQYISQFFDTGSELQGDVDESE